MVKFFNRLLFGFVFSALAIGIAPARARPADVAEKLTALKAALDAIPVQRCKNQWAIIRRIENLCTRALDSLVTPVDEASVALAEEEARVRKLACPSIVDYGCTAVEIQYRNAADLLASALSNLRDTVDNTLEDRNDGKWWDRAFVKDNYLSVVWAGEFVEKAAKAYEDALVITDAVASAAAKKAAK